MIIDGLVVIVPVLAMTWLASRLLPGHRLFFTMAKRINAEGRSVESLTLGLPGYLLSSALALSYFYVCEALTGQTLGKRHMGLRVQSAAGGPAGLNAVSARNVLRLIDQLPVLYLVGLLVAIVTGGRRRRIGDWLGGTVVVRAEDAAPPPQRSRWRVALYPVLWIGTILLATLALGLGNSEGAGLSGFVGAPRSCISTRVGNPEAGGDRCVVTNAAGGAMETIVADHGGTLHMPEYTATVGPRSNQATTLTEGAGAQASSRPASYTSVQVTITNTSGRPLLVTASATVPPGCACAGSTIALRLPIREGQPAGYIYAPDPYVGVQPSLFRSDPIPPHGTRTGWASFITPRDAFAEIGWPYADLEFAPFAEAAPVRGVVLWN